MLRPLILLAAVLLAWAVPGSAGPVRPTLASPAPAAAPERDTESDLRASPRYTVQKFLELTDLDQYNEAGVFLAWPYTARERASLARELKALIDRRGWISLSTISPRPEGNPDDFVNNPDLEKVGELKINGEITPIILQRAAAGHDGPTWLFEKAFLKKIPDLSKELTEGPIASLLPTWLASYELGALHLWQWLGLIVLAVVTFLIAALVTRALTAILRRSAPLTGALFESVALRRLLAPIILMLMLGLFRAGRALLELPLVWRTYIGYGEVTLVVIACVIFGMRMADAVCLTLQNHFTRTGKLNGMPMVPTLRKALKILVVGFALLATLRQFGFDITAVIAGLGVGGIAIALAGQKTIENLFGGITLILDQPVRVGDYCRFGTSVGTVEDIGLRSTRIRTMDRTVISIPNAEFSHMQIENFARRDKIRYHTILGVRCDTSPNQMRLLLIRIKELLIMHSMVELDPSRVRFIRFGASSFDIEVFGYVRTTDVHEFLAVSEDLNLRILSLLGELGIELAFPSQSLYLERRDRQSRHAAMQADAEVQRLLDAGELPLPFYPSAKAASLSDQLPFR